MAELPEGDGWQYEPKWDGFRCLAFKDGDEVALRSKSGQPLERYFPEVVEALKSLPASRCVLDGELVVPEGDALSFDAAADAHPSGAKPHPEARARASCALRRVRPARRRARQVAGRAAAGRAAWRARALRRARVRGHVRVPALAGDAVAQRGRRVVRSPRFGARRSDRQAGRPALPVGRAHRHAEVQAHADRRLRRRRVSLRIEDRRSSVRCCSACSTTKACCTTSVSRRASQPPSGTR